MNFYMCSLVIRSAVDLLSVLVAGCELLLPRSEH